VSVSLAWVVDLTLEVYCLADAEAEEDSASQELIAVRCWSPGTAGVSEDREGDRMDAIFVKDSAVVDEESSGQVRVVVHLDFDVDEEPLFGTIEQADFKKFVDPLGSDLGGWVDFAEFLLK